MSGPRRSRLIAAGTIVAAALLGGALGWLWSNVRPPIYAATATLMVQATASAGDAYEAARSDVALAPVLAALSIAPSRIAQIEDELRPVGSVADLTHQVNARSEVGTPFIAITARAPDGPGAAQFANRLAELAVESGGSPAGVAATRLTLVEPAATPNRPAYTRAPLAIATGALAAGALAFAILTLVRGRRHQPVPASLRVSSSQGLAIGVGLAVVIIGSTAIGTPEPAPQALTLLAAGLSAVSPSAGLALLALLFPLPDSGAFGPITLNLLVIGGITYGTIIDAAVRRDAPRIGLGTLAVLFYVGLAALASLPPLNGLDGERAVAPFARFLQLGAGLVLVLVAAYHFARHDPRPYVVLTAVSAAFAATLAIAQLVAGDATSLPAQGLFQAAEVVNVVRPSGPFVNANYFGLYMALGLVATLGGMLMLRRLRLLLIICAVPIAFALTFGSLSRGALLAVLPGVLILVWTWSRPRIALLATTVLVAMAVILYPLLLDARVARSETGTTADAEAGVSVSDQERLNAVVAAIPLFAVDPVFGVGFGQYHFESTRFVRSSHATSSHNQYLNILAEQGLVGVAAFAGLVAALIAGLVRARSGLSKLAMAMAATYAMAGLALEPLNSLQTSGSLWLVLGAGLATATLRQAAPAAAERTRRHQGALDRQTVKAVP